MPCEIRGPATASTLSADRLADLDPRQEDLGNAEIDLDRVDIGQRDQLLADRDIVADADRAQADHAVERRDDRRLRQLGLRRAAPAPRCRSELGGRLLERDLRADAALDQRRLRSKVSRARLRSACSCFSSASRIAVSSLTSAWPLRDALALLEAERDDAAGDLGSDHDGLVGRQRAQRLDLLVDRHRSRSCRPRRHAAALRRRPRGCGRLGALLLVDGDSRSSRRQPRPTIRSKMREPLHRDWTLRCRNTKSGLDGPV